MNSKFLFCWSIQSNPFWTKWCLFVLSLSCHIVGILVTLSALSHPEEAFRNISCLPGLLALGAGWWTESDPMCPRQCCTPDQSWKTCLDNWQFRLNCMTAAFRAELLLNLMSVFAHDEVVPKQNVRKIWMLLQSRVSTEIPWSNTTWRESEMYFLERHFIGL